MSLKVKDIIRIMENYAPSKLKEDYDNVGLMVGDSNEEVTSILVALDATLEVIEEAIEKKCNLILTHHPILFLKPKTITNDSLLGKKIIKLIKNNISVYSSHTNLDSVEGGINDIAAQILGYDEFTIIEKTSVPEYNNGKNGIGRLIKLNTPVKLRELCEKVKNTFNTPFVRYTGEDDKEINTIAIINGSGEDFFAISKAKGADCIITGDTTYHYTSDVKEEGIAVIDAGHFATEWPPMMHFGKKFEKLLRENNFDNKVYISEKMQDPYKFV